MLTDLFLSKTDELKEYMRQKHFFASHDIFMWGAIHYCNRADRYKRDFVKQGIIRRLSDEEKIFRGFLCRDSVYEWISNPQRNRENLS